MTFFFIFTRHAHALRMLRCGARVRGPRETTSMQSMQTASMQTASVQTASMLLNLTDDALEYLAQTLVKHFPFGVVFLARTCRRTYYELKCMPALCSEARKVASNGRLEWKFSEQCSRTEYKAYSRKLHCCATKNGVGTWRIIFYPRGNGQYSHMSVYVEPDSLIASAGKFRLRFVAPKGVPGAGDGDEGDRETDIDFVKGRVQDWGYRHWHPVYGGREASYVGTSVHVVVEVACLAFAS